MGILTNPLLDSLMDISYRLHLEKLASLLDTVEVVDPTAIVTVDMTGEMSTMEVPKYVFMSQVRG